MHSYLPYFASLTVAVIFGFSFIFTKEALNYLAPFQLLGFRFAVAALVLTLLQLTRVIRLDFSGKPIKQLLLLSGFQPLMYFICETIGVKLTSASEAGMMIAVIPVVATIFGAVFLKEHPSRIQTLFILLSVSGVLLILAMQGALALNSHFLGIMVLMGAVISAAAYNILSRKNSQQFSSLEITYVMMWVGAIVFNLMGFTQAIITQVALVDYFQALLNGIAYRGVLYLGILSSVVAFFLLNYSLANLKVSQAVVFTNLTTIISVMAGVLILKENFFWFHGLGGLLIIIGVWGTNYFAVKDLEGKNFQQGGA